MRNKNSTIFTVIGILGVIVGVLTVIFLIGIPIIIGASKYLSWAKMSNEEILQERDSVVLWSVVLVILLFPIGLIALIPVFNLDGEINKIISGDTEVDKERVLGEMLENLKKLHSLKEEGIISEEDFELAKKRILDKYN